jgi:hypothetical protein
MPRISMDGPENELAMVAIKNEITYIFYWSHLIFCNQNSAVSSTIHGEMLGGRQVVPSWMVTENGQSGWCAHFFDSGNMAAASTEHGREPQRTRATALAKRGWRRISREVVWRAVKL